MQSFDIDSLLRFTPPEFLCERCCAVLTHVQPEKPLRCPVCGVEYIPTEEFPSPADYLRTRGLELHFHDLIGHCQQLAHIGRGTRGALNGSNPSYPPMRALLASLACAERFVHFTTYGISAMLLGALRVAAQRVDVRGIVSGIKHDAIQRELTAYHDEAPRLQTRLFLSDAQFIPHQKIVVVDGLLAFKGSANMTDFGWRKAAQGREVLEVVTDVAEVVDLHNRYFSPTWASFEHAAAAKRIVMSAY